MYRIVDGNYFAVKFNLRIPRCFLFPPYDLYKMYHYNLYLDSWSLLISFFIFDNTAIIIIIKYYYETFRERERERENWREGNDSWCLWQKLILNKIEKYQWKCYNCILYVSIINWQQNKIGNCHLHHWQTFCICVRVCHKFCLVMPQNISYVAQVVVDI